MGKIGPGTSSLSAVAAVNTNSQALRDKTMRNTPMPRTQGAGLCEMWSDDKLATTWIMGISKIRWKGAVAIMS